MTVFYLHDIDSIPREVETSPYDCPLRSMLSTCRPVSGALKQGNQCSCWDPGLYILNMKSHILHIQPLDSVCDQNIERGVSLRIK